MIGLDTKVLARYFVEEADADEATQAQREAARQLIESGQDLFLPKTVALELVWVLRGYYGIPVEQVLRVLDQLLLNPCLVLEDRPAMEQAVAGLRSGLDFVDALHHASCRDCEAIASFDDRGFARRIRDLNLPPRVVVL
ncbi:type II toxin-antitoxin system VapC family toxin [Cyanobium sp. CH-040]|uniref:type II toxin-antitoxin system VapC family toxin n=1 Tax=Cyanobium sp. CH-040 TaxID=2823708 RepID=UPI0020CC7DE1|nr:type II toxin-antitoxin system VapC family toxin [Cyanobium sp. CH-040]MCP9927623.1 type II toxin-antitoxin system VapC family toxin [Cyanobium sp. CH-040]